MNSSLSHSRSVDPEKAEADASVFSELKAILTLGALTGIGIEFCRLFFKLERDVSQIATFPVVLLAFLLLLRRSLSNRVRGALLLTLPALAFSVFWTQGGLRLGGHAFISNSLLKRPSVQALLLNYNRGAELRHLPQLQTIYKPFNDATASSWGEGKAAVLVYSDEATAKMKLFFGALGAEQEVSFGDFSLTVGLFPEWAPFDASGTPPDYLLQIVPAVKLLKKLGREEITREEALRTLQFAAFAAGLSPGRWTTPAPRAAALILGATSNLSLTPISQTKELTCIEKQLRAALRKFRRRDAPELRAVALNNLAVTRLALAGRRGVYTSGSLALIRRQLLEAAMIRGADGKPTFGARLATHNLFALDGAGLRPAAKSLQRPQSGKRPAKRSPRRRPTGRS